jgi:hypothetical protein
LSIKSGLVRVDRKSMSLEYEPDYTLVATITGSDGRTDSTGFLIQTNPSVQY